MGAHEPLLWLSGGFIKVAIQLRHWQCCNCPIAHFMLSWQYRETSMLRYSYGLLLIKNFQLVRPTASAPEIVQSGSIKPVLPTKLEIMHNSWRPQQYKCPVYCLAFLKECYNRFLQLDFEGVLLIFLSFFRAYMLKYYRASQAIIYLIKKNYFEHICSVSLYLKSEGA